MLLFVFCFQLCSIFGGQICFKEAIMLVKYCGCSRFLFPLATWNARLRTPLRHTVIQRGLPPRWPQLSHIAWFSEKSCIYLTIKRRFPATLMYYLLPISGLFTLALAGDIAFFFYRVHNVVFNACMYACSLCMYAKYTFIPHRDIYYTLSGMVRSINSIFQDKIELYALCCAAALQPRGKRWDRGPARRSHR